MGRKIYLVAMAAGHGTRMGSKTPKQFMLLRDKPILQCTIEKFISACPGIKVVTVLPEDYIPVWKAICLKNNFIYPQILVKGGITRFHSVKNALKRVPEGAIVAIHDGVRPLLSVEMIGSMLKKIETEPSCKALIPVIPAFDTLVALKDISQDNVEAFERIEGVKIDRSEVFAIQTPQIFLSEEIKSAYNSQAYNTEFTDDSSVASKNNLPLTFCRGERLNIKITAPEDLAIAECLLNFRKTGH